jgi:xanthine dehydrogenase accessory factor
MFDEFLAKVTALRSEGCPFAVATVVRFQPPVSGRPGDKAIIETNGQISGWIGGGCTQPIVVQEALRAIENGKPKLVRIAPGRDSGAEYGVANYTMTCHGGGGMEIYIEPVLPPPQLLIFGRSLAAQALCKLGNTIGYSVIMVGPGLDRLQFHDANRIVESWDVRSLNLDRETYIVVSTQGEGDEEALEQAVRTNVPYVSFIASPTKAEKIVQFLADRGTAPEALSRVKSPAGLDICALGPEEIAISILAEIILIRRSGKPLLRNLLRKEASATNHAMDPICGMTVDAGGAGYFSEYKDRKYYFCSAGCKQEFDKQPEAHRVLPSPPG